IHMYQQSMMRAEEIRRRRREDNPGTHDAVNNILAAAAREMEEARHAARANERIVASIQTEQEAAAAISAMPTIVDVKSELDEDRPKKRASIMSPDDEKLRAKKKMTVRFQDDSKTDERPNKITSPGAPNNDIGKSDGEAKMGGGIKVVQLAVLQKPANNTNASNEHDDSDEKQGNKHGIEDDEETDSSGSISDSAANDSNERRPHECDMCDLRFQRSSHLSRHKLTHTGERPFTCGGCGRSFARSDKLRVHTKICEREDPTVDIAGEGGPPSKRESTSEVMSGTVRSTHRESGHLVFTASGDVMLPPRHSLPCVPTSMSGEGRSDATIDPLEPPRRGRGRPRKTPLPLTPKIKKKRGRPPKTSLDMEGCVLTGGSVSGVVSSPLAHAHAHGHGHGHGHAHAHAPAAHAHAASHQLLLKRKRGRPPKNYFMPKPGMDMLPMPFGLSAELNHVYGRPNENYNATNLPFGDFSYLTEMIYNPLSYNYGVSVETERSGERSGETSTVTSGETSNENRHERTIDVSSSSSEEEENRQETEENVDTQIMTVGDCQIVKLPPANEDKDAGQPSPSAVTITPITTVGDCTIRPVENT
ncbi:hypothetical protein ACJJTC_002542, partial [Scirpophaga incertulas]